MIPIVQYNLGLELCLNRTVAKHFFLKKAKSLSCSLCGSMKTTVRLASFITHSKNSVIPRWDLRFSYLTVHLSIYLFTLEVENLEVKISQ